MQQQAVVLADGGTQRRILNTDVHRYGLFGIRRIVHVIAQRFYDTQLALHLHQLLLVLTAHLHRPRQVGLQVRQSLRPFILFHAQLRLAQFPVDDGNTLVDEPLRVQRLHILVFDGLIVVFFDQRIQKISPFRGIRRIESQVQHRRLPIGLLDIQIGSTCPDHRFGPPNGNQQLAVIGRHALSSRKPDVAVRRMQQCRQSFEHRIRRQSGRNPFHPYRRCRHHLHLHFNILLQLVQLAALHCHHHRALRVQVGILDPARHNIRRMQIEAVDHRLHHRFRLHHESLVFHVVHRTQQRQLVDCPDSRRFLSRLHILQYHARGYFIHRRGIVKVAHRCQQCNPHPQHHPLPIADVFPQKINRGVHLFFAPIAGRSIIHIVWLFVHEINLKY